MDSAVDNINDFVARQVSEKRIRTA